MKTTATNRHGLSLLEVLIAFFVLTVGIVGIISLFPVGIQQVREAVFDTRSTIVALNAESTIELFDWANDPYLIRPPVNPLIPDAIDDTTQPPGWTGSVAHPSTLPAGDSVYVTQKQNDGTDGLTKSEGPSFPIYVDPVLANFDAFQSNADIRYKRVRIEDPGAAPWPAAYTIGTIPDFYSDPPLYADLPIYTVSDAQLMPATINGTSIGRREAFLRHWFFSDADMGFESQNPIIPLNPSRRYTGGAALNPWEYYQTTVLPGTNVGVPDQARPTVDRESLYSWSFAIDGRGLVDDGGGSLILSDPRDWRDRTQILVFYKRNFADPYRLARGCFFNGSNVATISWPATSNGRETTRPKIQRGTWLMEYTNTGEDTSGAGVAGEAISRHAIRFHRVANFEEPRYELNTDISDSNWLQSVTLESPVSDTHFPAHELTNLRPLPDGFISPNSPASLATPATGPFYYSQSAGAAAAVSAVAGIPTPADNTHVWVPVIFWDGLIEVFDLRN